MHRIRLVSIARSGGQTLRLSALGGGPGRNRSDRCWARVGPQLWFRFLWCCVVRLGTCWMVGSTRRRPADDARCDRASAQGRLRRGGQRRGRIDNMRCRCMHAVGAVAHVDTAALLGGEPPTHPPTTRSAAAAALGALRAAFAKLIPWPASRRRRVRRVRHDEPARCPLERVQGRARAHAPQHAPRAARRVRRSHAPPLAPSVILPLRLRVLAM